MRGGKRNYRKVEGDTEQVLLCIKGVGASEMLHHVLTAKLCWSTVYGSFLTLQST